MTDVHLKIIDAAAGAWTAELWSGFPGSAGTTLLAGGAAQYTQAQLERDGLDKAAVLTKIGTQDQPDDGFLAIGLRLYEFLESTGVAQQWSNLRTANPAGLRTYLEVPDSASQWPWELLAWPFGGNQVRYGFNSTLHPILRFSAPAQGGLLWTDTTVRIMLVSGQEDLDGNFKASDELRLIRKIFHYAGLSALVELCEAPATQHALQTQIDLVRPHILHFIGHGDMPGADYALQLLAPPSPVDWWATPVIGNFFGNSNWKPRLVVLNACHTAQYKKTAASVAEALLAAGIPAVIGAQAALRVDYARLFAAEFYRALTDPNKIPAERTLDKAMGAARMRLTTKARFEGLKGRHWALPVLKVNAPAEEILKFRPVHKEVMSCEVVKDVFTRPGRFVDRTADRRDLLSKFAPVLAVDPGYRGVILEGRSALGKSWLVKRAIRDFLDAGFLVRYAALPGPQAGRTSLDVLQDWRGRQGLNTFLLRPIPGSDFDDFDARLLEARANPTAAAIQLAFKAFKQGLQSARAGRKLLLVLGRFRHKDYASVSSPDFREGLLGQLLLPIQKSGPADPEVDEVYALLVCRDYLQATASGQTSDFNEYGLAQLDGFHRCPIDGFERGQLDNLWDEFADFTSNGVLKAFREGMRGLLQNPKWSPETLDHFNQIVVDAQQLPSEGGDD